MKCPGQDRRFWGPEAIFETSCPNCGGPVEFFKDESSRRCRKCGLKALNPKMDFGCAAYCRFAAQCLGTEMSAELLAKRTDLLKDRIAVEVKKFLGRDFKRIGRALKVMEYSRQIQRSEGGDPAIVTMAACLSAIAGGAGQFSPEDIAAAESILLRIGSPKEPADEVIAILNNLGGTGQPDHTTDCKCVRDAIRIADLAEALKAGRPKTFDPVMDRPLLTETGKNLVKKLLDESSVV